MPRAIHKYQLRAITEPQKIQIPQGFNILDVQMQQHGPVLWAAVDPEAPETTLQVWGIFTGHAEPVEGWYYLATVQQEITGLVFHYYAYLAEHLPT